MDAHAPCRRAVAVARLWLGSHPGSSAEVVEVSRRQGQGDGVLDLPCTVRAQGRAVKRLPTRPGGLTVLVGAAEELVDLDDEVVARAQPGSADRHGHD